ncbi:hypothetical protein [Sulfurovum mangrovi]|uniref:hypothetical protein n=1 Tax=Sulfurovum mangrovi TaxID=2893889 RepID=UPI001E64F229|nr:hypothetical protein [Sulfurovum mangrovi]UFH58498.1 hypothetical protein LN246_09055 [Sulfurovum mangrovi]
MKKTILFLTLLMEELLSSGQQLVGLKLKSNLTVMNRGERTSLSITGNDKDNKAKNNIIDNFGILNPPADII